MAASVTDPAAKSWRAQAFKPGDKYIVRRITDDEVKGWRPLLTKTELLGLKLEERQMYDASDWAIVRFGKKDFGKSLLAMCHEGYVDVAWSCEPSPLSPISNFVTDTRRFEFAGGFGTYVDQGHQERLTLAIFHRSRPPVRRSNAKSDLLCEG